MSSALNGPVDLSQCVAQVKSAKHDEGPGLLRTLSIIVTHAEHESAIASLNGLLIDRSAGRFREAMSVEPMDLLKFGDTLFDNRGNLRTWVKEDESRRGTGCWGSELNHGRMVYIQSISVREDMTGEGIGSWILQKLFSSRHVGAEDHVFCCPSLLDCDPLSEDVEAKLEDVVRFFRKNHFRRIGFTQYFAYSPQKTQPSRGIPPDSDANPEDMWNGPGATFTSDMRSKYPLHHAIVTDKSDNIVVLIRSMHAADPSCVHTQDYQGFFPVHAAAMAELYGFG
ncbi:hypothetical protein HGRIS_006260 [Hohenbuehelia grisea]|uniref:N-acetyltransferase domain-containing protein n=1 Tax=Hohenbuehelia grisea TaxID=104357 RepID=A0ABR3K270_9AGAR